MSSINILYLHEASEMAGAENSLLNLAVNLDRARFKPFFILPQEGLFVSELRKSGIEVALIPFPKIRRLFGVLKTIKDIRRVIKCKGINIVHSNSIRTHLYAVLAAKLNRIPVIWHERNLINREWIDPERAFSFLPDKIICNSYAVARRFLKQGNLHSKIAVVYNGVDTSKFNPVIDSVEARRSFGIGPEKFVVGMASRFNSIKGHETFFRAAELIFKKDISLKDRLFLLVAGSSVFKEDKHMEDHLRELINELGIRDNVVFAGFRQDMPKIYAAMDVLVLSSDAEACGRVIIEAMAAGRPVIATNTGGSPEIVKEGVTGLLFNPRNHGDLAQKILILAQDSFLAKKMGAEARILAENIFKIENNVSKIEEIYNQLNLKYAGQQ